MRMSKMESLRAIRGARTCHHDARRATGPTSRRQPFFPTRPGEPGANGCSTDRRSAGLYRRSGRRRRTHCAGATTARSSASSSKTKKKKNPISNRDLGPQGLRLFQQVSRTSMEPGRSTIRRWTGAGAVERQQRGCEASSSIQYLSVPSRALNDYITSACACHDGNRAPVTECSEAVLLDPDNA